MRKVKPTVPDIYSAGWDAGYAAAATRLSEQRYTIAPLTKRELVLVRVALLRRLTALKEAGFENSPSYRDTHALLDNGGKIALDTMRKQETNQ